MAFTLAALITAAGVTGGIAIGTVTITYASIIATAVLIATSVAINYAMMQTPKPTDGQQTLQQPTPFRRRIYGRAKVGGFHAFYNSANTVLFDLLMVASHQLDGIEEHWLGDRQVSLTGDGHVDLVIAPANANPKQFRDRSNNDVVKITANLGGPGKTANADLISAFPSLWTSQHVGHGVADVMIQQHGVPSDIFAQVYPGGPQPYRAVLRGALIEDPRVVTSPATAAWNDNAIAVIRDYLTFQDGWRIPSAYLDTGTGAVTTVGAANIADEFITLNSGGSERRYRIWGFYDYSDEPRQVLARMLAACAGWLQFYPDGTIGIHAGAWEEPTVTIVDDWIMAFEVQHFVGEFNAVNEIRATFADPQNDYQDTESVPWDDDDDIARRGYVKATDVDARYCPSYTQTRRIQKIAIHEAAPEYTINLTTNANGLAARGSRFVNLQIDKLGVSGTFRITSFVANVQTGACSIGLASFDSSAYDWDPATEEGPPPPIAPDSSNAAGVEAPQNLTVTVVVKALSGTTQGAYMHLVVDAPTVQTGATTRFDYQPAGASTWTSINIDAGTYSADTPVLTPGRCNVRAAFLASSGVRSAFDEVDNVNVQINLAAPSAPTNLTATPVTATHIQLSVIAPNDPNVTEVQFYRNSTNSFSGSTLIDTAVAKGNQQVQFTDLSGTVTSWYFATAVTSVSPPSVSTPVGGVQPTTPPSGGGTLVVSVSSSPFALGVPTGNPFYVDITNTSGAPLVVELSASPAIGQIERVTDVGGTAGTNAFTIKDSTGTTTIDTIVVNNGWSTCRWNGTAWILQT